MTEKMERTWLSIWNPYRESTDQPDEPEFLGGNIRRLHRLRRFNEVQLKTELILGLEALTDF
jgi:hypothetical protein